MGPEPLRYPSHQHANYPGGDLNVQRQVTNQIPVGHRRKPFWPEDV